MAYAIYEMEPSGKDGELEANGSIYWFCSNACLEMGKAMLPEPIKVGTDTDWIPGTRCEGCGNPLVEDDTPTNGAVLSDEEIALERSQLTQDEQKTLSTLPTPSDDDADDVDNTVMIQASRRDESVIVRFEDINDHCQHEQSYKSASEMGFDVFQWVHAGKLPKV